MQLKIKNRLITEPIINILYQARREANNGKLKDIIDKHNGNLLISCPCHKDGFERRPSCTVAISTETELEPGFAHCFTCGYSAPLTQLITDVFNEDDISFGEEWIKERFGTTLVSSVEYLSEIILEKPKIEKTFLDESTLTEYDYYHPYMWYRKLSKEVVDMFRVGYDKNRDAITFPVYDEKHRLVMVTARSVNTKRFWIPADVQKPVYLLYHLLENNIKTAYVCESQINTLYMWSLGYPSCGLFGTGSETQYETLRKCGIRNFITLFDGDEAGQKGAYRFRKNMPKDCFITTVNLPAGKDVNDLSAEQIKELLDHS
jgi:DNA primase